MGRSSLNNAFALLELEPEAGSGSGTGGSKSKSAKAKAKANAAKAAASEPAAAAGQADELLAGRDSAATMSEPLSEPLSELLSEPLVWIDCEMTGLEVDVCAIIEIAVLITDGQLGRVVEGPDLVIHQSEAVLAGMNEWCVEQHGKSGLTQRVRESRVSLEEAETAVLAFVAAHTQPGTATLAGNSVHCDLAFIKRYMPRLAAHLHYRIVDVSSVRELASRWFPNHSRRAPRKSMQHTAKADILESLEELRFLRKAIFKPVGNS